MRRSFVAFLLSAWSFGGGCSEYESGPVALTDGGTVMPEAGPPTPMVETVLYVAGQSGDDTRAGTAPETALRTIGNAIGLATGKSNVEIRVCRGTYAERNLVISKSMRLRGGYNCSSWQRSADTFGFAHGFTDVNETVLMPEASQTERATLTVRGIAAESVFVDGFTVQGVDAVANNAGAAILLADKAVLSVEESNIRGGAGSRGTTPAGPGSIGIWATSGVLKVSKSRVAGGTGKSESGIGSVGVEVANAEANISGSFLRSNAGVGTFCGVAYHGTNSRNTLHGSTMDVEPCTTIAGLDYPGAVGVWTVGGETKVTESKIGVASITCSAAVRGCVTHGIAASGTSVEVSRNWVWGVSPQDTASVKQFRGIQANRAGNAIVRDNVVHLTTEGTGAGLGIYIFLSPSVVTNNAVVGIAVGATTATLTGLQVQASTNSTSDNNLVHLAGIGFGFYSHRCPATGYVPAANDLLLRNNASYQADLVLGMRLTAFSGSPCTRQSYLSMQDPGSSAGLGSTPLGNVDLTESLLDPPDPAQWLTAVKNRTLKLATTKRVCAIAKKGIDVGGSATDIAGNPRDPKMPTIGPWEANVACN